MCRVSFNRENERLKREFNEAEISHLTQESKSYMHKLSYLSSSNDCKMLDTSGRQVIPSLDICLEQDRWIIPPEVPYSLLQLQEPPNQ